MRVLTDRNQLFGESKPGATSLGQKIRHHVLEHINNGEWPGGFRIPSEMKLGKQLGASRMTVHIALRDLAAEGVLLRRQGAGTFVAPRQRQSTFLELRNIHSEIRARGNEPTTEVIISEQLPCNLSLATEMEVAPGTPVFHTLLVHKENSVPIQIEDRFVNPKFSPDYLEQDLTRIIPYEHLMACGPLDRIEHVIQALIADERNSNLLEIDVGDPVLMLRRRTWSGNAIASSAQLLHPGDRFSLAGQMQM